MLKIYGDTQQLHMFNVSNMCTVRLNCESFLSLDWVLTSFLYLIVTLLGNEATLPDDQVEGSTGHQRTMTHVSKHHRKQEREGNDGVGSCNRQHNRMKPLDKEICNKHWWMLKLTSCWELKCLSVKVKPTPDCFGIQLISILQAR